MLFDPKTRCSCIPNPYKTQGGAQNVTSSWEDLEVKTPIFCSLVPKNHNFSINAISETHVSPLSQYLTKLYLVLTWFSRWVFIEFFTEIYQKRPVLAYISIYLNVLLDRVYYSMADPPLVSHTLILWPPLSISPPRIKGLN